MAEAELRLPEEEPGHEVAVVGAAVVGEVAHGFALFFQPWKAINGVIEQARELTTAMRNSD